jgi:hypothetical protein
MDSSMNDDEGTPDGLTPDQRVIAKQHEALLVKMGPFITDLFRDPLVQNLIEPAVVIDVPSNPHEPVKARIIERVELTGTLAVAPVVSINPNPLPLPIEVVIASPELTIAYLIHDPRTDQWARALETRRLEAERAKQRERANAALQMITPRLR